MIQKRQLLINAAMSVVQVVVTGGAFFVLYRFAIDQVGADAFGVWTLVLTMTTASNVANLGLASSAVKFVSQHLAREDAAYVAAIIQTALLTLGVVLAAVLFALYPLLGALLRFFIDTPEQIPAALSILPYAAVSFWISSVAGVALAGLDGHQRVDLRSALLTITTLIYLGLAFLLVPQRGLIGLAQAQVGQAAILGAAAWVLLKRLQPALPILPYQWHRGAFKEMFGYSVNFQVISLSKLLFEPVTKALLSKFGGLAVLAYFEFAHRMVFQLRALIVTAHQSIVPTIADLQEKAPLLIRDLYTKSCQLLIYLILFALPLLIALTPVISRAWIGTYQPTFIIFAVFIFLGWFTNILSGPAYFANLGTGHLRWNVAGHLVTGVLNVGLGLLLGRLYGGTGVVVGFMLALIMGSLTLVAAYQRTDGIRLRDVFQGASLRLAGMGLLALALAAALYYRFLDAWPWYYLGLIILLGYLALVGLPAWIHPVRRQIQVWVVDILFKRPSPTSSADQ